MLINVIRGILLVACTTSAMQSYAVGGYYDHDSKSAILLLNSALLPDFTRETPSVIASINFVDKKTEIIARGDSITDFSLNKAKTHIAMTDKSGLHIIDIEKKIVVSNFDVTRGHVFWGNHADKVAIFAYTGRKRLIIVDLASKSITKASGGEREVLRGVKWSENCSCFLFELQTINTTNRRFVSIANDLLQENKSIKTTSISHNKKYYLLYSEDEISGTTAIYYNNGDKIAWEHDGGSAILTNYVVWGSGDTFKIIGRRNVFDVINKKVVNLGGRVRISNELISMRDIATDGIKYVLIWNGYNKKYEVQDIDIGKIIGGYTHKQAK